MHKWIKTMRAIAFPSAQNSAFTVCQKKFLALLDIFFKKNETEKNSDMQIEQPKKEFKLSDYL